MAKKVVATQEEKKATVNAALQMLQSKYGATAIGLLGKMPTAKVDAVSSGIPDLDMALGVGGIPLGRIIEAFGGEASGKTTLMLIIIASFQRAGKKCAFIDAEHALDPERAQTLGVNLDELLFCQPDSAEQALDIAYDIAATGEYSFIVVDSVSALVPEAEAEADMDKNTIGLQARLLSKACRKLTGVMHKNKCTIGFINQLREKVGGYAPNGQVPTTTSGGRALKFFSSIRMEIKKGDILGTYEKQQGHTAKVKTVKNKVSAPFKNAEFDIYSDERGVDIVKGLINRCVEIGIMVKSGSWHYYPDKENPATINGTLCKWISAAKATEEINNNEELKTLLYDRFLAEFKSNVRVVEEEILEADQMSDDEIVEAVVNGSDEE